MKKVTVTFENEDKTKKAVVVMSPIDDDRLETVCTFEPEIRPNETGESSTYAMVAVEFLHFVQNREKYALKFGDSLDDSAAENVERFVLEQDE